VDATAAGMHCQRMAARGVLCECRQGQQQRGTCVGSVCCVASLQARWRGQFSNWRLLTAVRLLTCTT
jgi:hypothetical protein